jgi:hypothetical protein
MIPLYFHAGGRHDECPIVFLYEFNFDLAGLVAVSLWPSRTLAQDDHMHAMPSTPQALTATQLQTEK